jgi:hypothetical protein
MGKKSLKSNIDSLKEQKSFIKKPEYRSSADDVISLLK